MELFGRRRELLG